MEFLPILEKLESNNGNSDRMQIFLDFCEKFSQYKSSSASDDNFLYDRIFPKIYRLINSGIIDKNVLFLTLIQNENKDTIKKLLRNEKLTFKFDYERTSSYFNYCIYKKNHWLQETVKNPENFIKIIPRPIYLKILILRLIEVTNQTEIDFTEVDALLENIGFDILSEIPDLFNNYINKLKQHLDISKYCKSIKSSIELREVFQFSVNNALLDTYTKFLNLETIPSEEIYDKLKLYDAGLDQTTTFKKFSIINRVLSLVNKFDKSLNVNREIEEIETDLRFFIENKTVLLELLENIFMLLFLKPEHFMDLDCERNGFLCGEKEVRIILFLVKNVLDDVKLKNLFDAVSDEYGRFIELNKIVADATWRLELVVNVQSAEKCEKNLIFYMLASAESLIHLSLKRGDFMRAYQIIRIFDLFESPVALKVKHSKGIHDLRESLKKSSRIQAIHKQNPSIPVSPEMQPEKLIEDFFKKNPYFEELQPEDSIHFKPEHGKFRDIFDIALTLPGSKTDSETLLELALVNNTLDNSVTSNYSIFCKKVIELFNEEGNKKQISIPELLIESDYDLEKTRKAEELYKELLRSYDEFTDCLKIFEPGGLNPNHLAHKSFLKLNKVCSELSELQSGSSPGIDTKYLLKLYNYLKAFSKVLYIEQNSSDIVAQGRNISYFELLNHNRSELMGKLLFQMHLDPGEFEKYFGKLKLDYLYHVIGNCFPTINLHALEDVTEDELYPENSLYVPSKNIITYIQKRNWLLAFILNEMYRVEGVNIGISEVRVKVFLNYLELGRMTKLKPVFGNNVIITALQNDINVQKVLDYVNKQVLPKSPTLSNSQLSSDSSVETGEELLEDALRSTHWKELFELVNSIPEVQLRSKPELKGLRDMVLVNLVVDGIEVDYYKFVKFIENDDLRTKVILEHMYKWPGEFCIELIKGEVSRFGFSSEELKKKLREVELCEELKTIVSVSTWTEVLDKCKVPELVISLLINQGDICKLLRFLKIFQVPANSLLQIRTSDMIKLFESTSENQLEKIRNILNLFPKDHSLNLCEELLKNLPRLEHLKFLTNYLLSFSENKKKLRKIDCSLKILSKFNTQEQEQLLCLVGKPLDIIEILIMNMKLDKLGVSLKILYDELVFLDDEDLCVHHIDGLLRKYAEKSLDFRVITQPNPRLLRTPEYKLMQSLDSLTDQKSFTMPEFVPDKDDWVQNNEVLECMCCSQVTFSMFNRRHHCRRCGRVICYNCSRKRMLVDTYGDLLVRVCNDCYSQTYEDSTVSDMNETTSIKSDIHDHWLFTDDPEHNEIIREEFSYEHAPSVSLCLSIMKYHSKTVDYPNFLLDQCNVMLKLLQPSQEPVQEIDYLLVIKMLKSLAMAAKVSSVECNLHFGTSLSDRILSQADLLALLSERGCLNLLPITSPVNQSPYIDASSLRRLRDRLLEREQWNLALEVSTKAGLDNSGVFAAWGKSCLKAGCLSLAREKFQRCLDKTAHYGDASDYTIPSELDESSDSQTLRQRFSSTLSLSEKPSKNPPLLNDIIHILESKTKIIDIDVLKELDLRKNYSGSSLGLNQSFAYSAQPDIAISILNKLKNLKNTVNGNYSVLEEKAAANIGNKPRIDPVFYKECVYYLSRYGTHLSLLEFYIKHGEVNKALEYIVEARLSGDVFIEVYMRCLKEGIINVFQEEMSKIDSTLDVWKDYLRQICRHLEKQNLLNSLYQLQQFMGDYIRAAMTCIRFYQDQAKDFTDIYNRIHYLHKAEEHLKQVLEQEQWVEVASVQSINSSESFEEKGITNPSLVMKINTKDIDKHISTIWLQNEVVKFLAECENNSVKPMNLLKQILLPAEKNISVPTLFGSNLEKIYLAVLIILCGKQVEDGFDLALKIITDFKLKPVKVYCEVGKQLAKDENYAGIAQLVNCIKGSGTNDAVVTDICDEMLTLAVATFTKGNVTGTKVEDLIKLISDRATKISAYIEAKQLKTAYFLAIKYKRMGDIRRILREAELLNQPSIKALCQKVLQSHANASHSKE